MIAAACGGDDDEPSTGGIAAAVPPVQSQGETPVTATTPPVESDRSSGDAAAVEAPSAADGAGAPATLPNEQGLPDEQGADEDRADGGRGVIAGLDTSIRSVDLEEIEFDLFNGSKISLAEVDEATIVALIDVIPPLDGARDLLPESVQAQVGTVEYVSAEEASYLPDEATVLGYVADDGRPYAYPIGILQFHEFVNDTLGGRAVLISFCPLCRSAVVYDRVVDGEGLTFGNTSALYQNDAVMFDRQTNSYWFQVAGKAVIGPLTGSRLTVLPSVMMPWASWLREHPDTLVLSNNTGFPSNYAVDVFAEYDEIVSAGRLPFSVSEEVLADRRLDLAELVLGLEVGAASRAYPLNQLGTAAVNDDVGGRAVVVFTSADGPTGAAFDPVVDGQRLTFDVAEDGFRDRETGTEWTFAGRATDGALQGRQLTPLPTRTAYWFSYRSAFPDVTIAEPEPAGAGE